MRSRKDQETVDALTKIFSDAFAKTAEETGVPAKTVAEQFCEELSEQAKENEKKEKLALN